MPNYTSPINGAVYLEDPNFVPGGGGEGGTAEETTLAPFGSIAATNVQDGLEEIVTEMGGGGGTAASVSYAGGTGMSATNVEAAIDELATEKANKTSVDALSSTLASMYSSDLDPRLDALEAVAPAIRYELTWDGSDYQPTALKSDTSVKRLFLGPEDPDGFSGVTLSSTDLNDLWQPTEAP
jgi:hypothetical protein